MLTRAPSGEVGGEALELEETLGRQRVAGQELRELVHLPGSECHVDERKLREDLVLDRLRPAASDPDHHIRAFALDALGVSEMRDELRVSGLADRARVEENDVGVALLGRRRVAERLQHPLHALGVVLVHLAAERRDVVALHERAKPSRVTSRNRLRATRGSR